VIKKSFKSICKIFVPPITRWLPRFYFGLKYLNLKSFKPNGIILDAGCSYGPIAIKIAKNNIQTIGIDLLEAKISVAREIALKIKNSKKINFLVSNMINLPFPDDFFDAVIALDSIEFVKNDKKAFQEFYRVLKPSGRLIVSVLHKTLESEDKNLSPEQKLLRKLLPKILYTKKQPYNGKNLLIATAKDKMKKDGRFRNYTIEDIEKKIAPYFKITRSEYIIKRFSRLCMDITYSIKGANFLKPFLFTFAIAMDKIFCKKNKGFAIIVEMKKNN